VALFAILNCKPLAPTKSAALRLRTLNDSGASIVIFPYSFLKVPTVASEENSLERPIRYCSS
jgi:hypothetical protein